MNESALPRRWKEFDGRWRRASRMEKFIIVSILLHIVIGLCWGIPKYLAYRTKQEVLLKKAEIEREQREKAEEELAAAEETIKEEENEELAEAQLKEFFEELTKDLLSPEEMEKRWEELVEALTDDLEEFGEYIESDGFDELEADEMIAELKEKMLDELHDKVARDLQEDWKERYLKYLERATEKLAKLFRGELDKRIGQPLNRESENMMRREVAAVKRQLDTARREMDSVKRTADDVRRRVDQSNKKVASEKGKADAEKKKQASLDDRLKKAEAAAKPNTGEINNLRNQKKQSEQREKNSHLAMKREAGALRDPARKLGTTKKPLEQAAKRVGEFAPETAKRIESLRSADVPKAEKEVKGETQNLDKGDAEKALAEGKKAKETVDKISKEAGEAAKEIGKIKAEDVVRDRFRKVLAALERDELKKAFREAFDKEYKDNALPQLKAEINKQFQEEAKKKGLIPPPISIEKELSELLGVKVPDKTKAGETTTADIKKKQGLEKIAEKPGDGELEKKAGDHTRKTAKGLIDSQMKSVVGSALGKKGSWLLNNELELDEHGKADVALLDRLGNLKNQMGQGRKEFLGRGNSASLASARRRRLSLMRMRGRALGRYYQNFDKTTFLAMIEKMRNRESARGDAFALKGEAAEATKAEDADELGPEYMLAAAVERKAPGTPEATGAEAKREVAKPKFKYNKFAGIPYLNTPIKIDGDLSDWKERKIPKLLMAPSVKGPNKGTVFPNQEFWLAYDSNGLYIGVNAKDTNGSIQDHQPLSLFWLNDCVEAWIDAQNTKYSRRGEVHTHQFYVFPFGQKNDREAGGWEAYFDPKARFVSKHPRHAKDVIRRAAKKTPEGWTVEFIIPKTIIRSGELKPGRILGFTISCCTGTDTYYYWSFQHKLITSENPHTWGDIQLLGSDAELAIIEADGKKEKSFLVPGEPLGIRVTDGDMDLDEKAKDRVRVSVSAASGDYESVVLEETGANTGVFVGSITTRPNIGAMTSGLLELFEGESVEVTYIDQAQAFGERDVKMLKALQVTAAGVKFIAERR